MRNGTERPSPCPEYWVMMIPMLEYHILRALLGIAQLGLCYLILNRSTGYLLAFGVTMFACAANNLAPAVVTEDIWMTYLQLPMYGVLAILMAYATLEIFAFMARKTFREERVYLAGWSIACGICIAYAASCVPRGPVTGWYGHLMIWRQYFMICLWGSFAAAWSWVRLIRPIPAEQHVVDHGNAWGLWLAIAAAMSATTQGGLFWALTKWQGGGDMWRLAGDILVSMQMLTAIVFGLNLWNWKGAAANSRFAQYDLLGLARPHEYHR